MIFASGTIFARSGWALAVLLTKKPTEWFSVKRPGRARRGNKKLTLGAAPTVVAVVDDDDVVVAMVALVESVVEFVVVVADWPWLGAAFSPRTAAQTLADVAGVIKALARASTKPSLGVIDLSEICDACLIGFGGRTILGTGRLVGGLSLILQCLVRREETRRGTS